MTHATVDDGSIADASGGPTRSAMLTERACEPLRGARGRVNRVPRWADEEPGRACASAASLFSARARK